MTSIRLSAMAWEATGIPALRAGRMLGYSNSENSANDNDNDNDNELK